MLVRFLHTKMPIKHLFYRIFTLIQISQFFMHPCNVNFPLLQQSLCILTKCCMDHSHCMHLSNSHIVFKTYKNVVLVLTLEVEKVEVFSLAFDFPLDISVLLFTHGLGGKDFETMFCCCDDLLHNRFPTWVRDFRKFLPLAQYKRKFTAKFVLNKRFAQGWRALSSSFPPSLPVSDLER